MRPGNDALRVLIAGGGVAALEAMLALRALAEERVEIELLAPEPYFVYRPLSVAEPFGTGHVERRELTDFAEAASARLVRGALEAVDRGGGVARTARGAEIAFDALLIACGASTRPSVGGAFAFGGPEDVEAFGRLLKKIEQAGGGSVVFAVPGGVSWPLPVYELCLQTAAYFAERGLVGPELSLVTYESAPLQLLGETASSEVRRMLDDRGIRFHPEAHAVRVEKGELALVPPGGLPADWVITVPRLAGRRFEGVPSNPQGFIPVDRSCAVAGLLRVYAAGDITAFPIKHGGLAAEQADAAAGAIAALAGAPVTPELFTPVLRGLLLTGGLPAYVRADLGRGDAPTFSAEPLWWPPGKIVGRHLAPRLASMKSDAELAEPPRGAAALKVEIDVSGEPRAGDR
jgi:sulfide:quinone oxidoreductase